MVAVREPMAPLYAEKNVAPQLARHESSGLDREFDVQFDLGVSAQRKGDFQKAIRHYTNAIKLDLRCPEAYINRAVAYESAGNLDLALQDTETAIALESKAEAYHNRGNLHFKQDNYDQAVHDYSKALELNPDITGTCLKPRPMPSDTWVTSATLSVTMRQFWHKIQLMPPHTSAWEWSASLWARMTMPFGSSTRHWSLIPRILSST